MSPLGYTPCFAVANFLDPQVPLCPHNQRRVMSPVCTSLVWAAANPVAACWKTCVQATVNSHTRCLWFPTSVVPAQSCMACHHSLLTRHWQWRNLSRIIVCHCTIARLSSGVLPWVQVCLNARTSLARMPRVARTVLVPCRAFHI